MTLHPVVLSGSPAAEIGAWIDTHGADLMVVGTHGHGPVRRFLLGSVAERLIRMSRCPVLAVPHESLRAKPAATEAIPAAVGVGGTAREPVDEQC